MIYLYRIIHGLEIVKKGVEKELRSFASHEPLTLSIIKEQPHRR